VARRNHVSSCSNRGEWRDAPPGRRFGIGNGRRGNRRSH
jgi:hypothetical protein